MQNAQNAVPVGKKDFAPIDQGEGCRNSISTLCESPDHKLRYYGSLVSKRVFSLRRLFENSKFPIFLEDTLMRDTTRMLEYEPDQTNKWYSPKV